MSRYIDLLYGFPQYYGLFCMENADVKIAARDIQIFWLIF